MIERPTLQFAGHEWMSLALTALGVALILVGMSYRRTPASRGLRLACATLKLLGVAALLLCLLEPMWTGERVRPGANLLGVIADNSLSMKLRGRGEKETRAESLTRVVTGEDSQWREPLKKEFEVRNYLADTRLVPTQDFHELDFSGRASALGAALKTLAERHRGQPLAGVMLFTDGVAPDLEGADLTGLPPIYPVVFGNDLPPRDFAVANPSVAQTSFEDAPVTIQAEIAAIGGEGEEVVARLLPIDPAKPDAEVKPEAEQKITIAREGAKNVVRFQVRPAKSGVVFYRLQVRAKQNPTDEATLANNDTIVTVDRGTGPHRILYVSGRPNWEYKFLQRAIVGDDQTQLIGLIRIAKREPKFDFRGRTGESSNPLFRGFGNQSKEEIERYDQPVLVTLNTEDEAELRGGFPKTPEELGQYEALIIDDLEAEFFTADQMSMIQRFVSERGGSLLMLGGAESFTEGKYQRTAIGDLLPVYLEGHPPAGPRELHLRLTREGWLQPWTRLRASEAQERARLEEIPFFDSLNATGNIKPAAMVVATVSDGQKDYPAIVTQRFGRGRSAALLIGDLWQSGLGDEARQKDLGKAWRQLVRWLVADVPPRIELRAEPAPDALSVRLTVRARDAKFQPIDNAGVTLKVHPLGSKQPITLTAEPSATEAGLYEAVFVPRESNGFRVETTVLDENGANVGTAATGWTTDLAATEFQSLTPNRALMEMVAKKTGGQVLTSDQIAAFAADLPNRRAPVTEIWTQPLWHTPWMLFLALGCLVGEWGLRRWKGLA